MHGSRLSGVCVELQQKSRILVVDDEPVIREVSGTAPTT
jgi:hypothetical protein